MTISQIENNIEKLLSNFTQEQFIFDFFLAYGEPKATISRLKKGEWHHRKKLFGLYEGMVEDEKKGGKR